MVDFFHEALHFSQMICEHSFGLDEATTFPFLTDSFFPRHPKPFEVVVVGVVIVVIIIVDVIVVVVVIVDVVFVVVVVDVVDLR